jgi:hypothetical protein
MHVIAKAIAEWEVKLSTTTEVNTRSRRPCLSDKDQIKKQIVKLRWMGMDDEAFHLITVLASIGSIETD